MKKGLKKIYLSIRTRLKITKKSKVRVSKRWRLHNLSKRVRAYFVISGGSLSIVETSKHIICPPPVPVAQMRRQAGLLSDREFYPETQPRSFLKFEREKAIFVIGTFSSYPFQPVTSYTDFLSDRSAPEKNPITFILGSKFVPPLFSSIA